MTGVGETLSSASMYPHASKHGPEDIINSA